MDVIHQMLEQAKREGWGFIGDIKTSYWKVKGCKLPFGRSKSRSVIQLQGP